LKPVKPIEHSVAIPITNDTPIPSLNDASIPPLDSPVDDVITSILNQLDRDTNVNKLIESGGIDVKEFAIDLGNTDPNNAYEMIMKLKVDNLKKIMKARNLKPKGNKPELQKDLFRSYGLHPPDIQPPKPKKSRRSNPEIGSVPDKVERLEKRARKQKGNV
jgi:uncharacterized protein with GYD domain